MPTQMFFSVLVVALKMRGFAQGRDEACQNSVSFVRQTVTDTANGAWSVFGADLDGDGDIDVLSGSHYDHTIAWYENDGGNPPKFEKKIISEDARGATSVFAADLDGDGDVDVLSASYNDEKVAWYENDGGSPPNFQERAISLSANGAESVFAADVDGDGRLDVLSASLVDDTIAWYENVGGTPSNFEKRVITNEADYAYSVYALDLDGDGDVDVLSGSLEKIEWYENDGGSPPAFEKRVIIESFSAFESIFAIDLDDDGDVDILSASSRDNTIAWYENDGNLPPSFERRVITTAADDAMSVFAADLDNDDDIDVLVASSGDVTVVWYENDGGSPPTFARRTLLPVPDEGRSVFAIDVDGDNDIDILSASAGDDTIAFYENRCLLAPTSQPASSDPKTTAPSKEPTALPPTVNSLPEPTQQHSSDMSGPTASSSMPTLAPSTIQPSLGKSEPPSRKKKKSSHGPLTKDWFWAMVGSIIALLGLVAPAIAYICCRKSGSDDAKRGGSMSRTEISFSPSITIHNNSGTQEPSRVEFG